MPLTANDKPVGWSCGFCHASVPHGGHHDCRAGRDAYALCVRCGESCALDAPEGVCSDCRDVYEPLVSGVLRGQTVTLCAVTIGLPDGEPIRWRAWSRERPRDAVAEGDTPERALVAFFDACAEREARP